MEETRFSKLLCYNECSDVPNLSRLGVFSCSQCDLWRERKACSSNASLPERSSLSSRYQCSRPGPRYIRIVCRAPVNGLTCSLPIVSDKGSLHAVDESQSGCTRHVKKLKRSLAIQSTVTLLHRDKKKKIKEQLAEEKRTAKEACALALEASLLERKATVREAKLSELSDLLSKKCKQLEEKDAVLKESRAKLKISQSLATYYKKKNQKRTSNEMKKSNHAPSLESAIRKVYPTKHPATKAKLLMEEIMSGRLFNGESLKLAHDFAQSYVRDLFKPWRMLKASDMSSVGASKTSTIKALNEVIDSEGLGLFPSASSVDRARAKLDQFAFETIGYERRETVYGEVFFLNFEKALRHLLKACQLDELATREGIRISLSIDGADLFKDRTHVSAGIKITDTRGVHPVTKQPLFMVDNDTNEEKIVKIQSSEMCCILVIADARDKKEMYEEVFREFYDWGKRIGDVGLPASDGNPALVPFHVTHTTDLKASWHLSNRGGGCKNKLFFCTFCPCTKNTLLSYKINDDRCARCKRRNKMKCYHHDMCDSVSVPALLHALEQELGTYYEQHKKTFQAVISRSKLRTDYTQVNKETDIMHIDYVIQPDDEEKLREYTQFISKECRLRCIPMNGRLDEWRSALKACVAMERAIFYLEQVKKWYESGRLTVPLVEIIEILIPCILHCENRVGEKIITIILRRQLDKFSGQKMDFIDAMDETFQTKVLGSVTSPSHWRLKHSKDSDGQLKLESLQVRNQTVRKMLDSIDIIVEDAAGESDDEFKTKMIFAVASFKEAMKILTTHRSLTEEEMERFQDKIDDFYETWIDLFGEEGITNYIHLLGSGHMLYFLKKYGCLYIYSQQGWEDLNNRCQAYLLHNTSRGGYGSGQGKGKSYTFLIVRFILRDLLWKTGDADIYFNTLE